MRHTGNRTISVDKKKLIEKIRENKANHIVEFKEAVINYKAEALRQLTDLQNKVLGGALDIKLNLVTPIDNSANYDNIIEMFEWEVNDTVTLEQNEFIEYVQDETSFAITAKMSNMAYSHR